MARAFYIASTGRPGPVVIDLTKDAQINTLDWSYSPCRFIRSYDPYPEIPHSDICRVAEMINDSARPMILAGQGITIAEAERSLLAVAEKADIPVAMTLLGLSAMPSGHRLNRGMLGMHGNIAPNVNTNHADLLIAVGMRFDDRVTGDVSRYAPDARIVHIDIDESEFNKNIRTDATILGDARQVLELLLPQIAKNSHSEWIGSFDIHDKVERARVIAPVLQRDNPDEPPTMGEVAEKVSLAAHNSPILVTDVGQNQMFGARYFHYSAPRSIISSGGLGTMGFGLPAAIGAKMGAPHRDVCLLMGDGGFQMTIQELGTIMQYGTDVKMVVLNNSFLGNVRQWQSLFFNNRFSQTPMVNPDFCAIAAAYSIEAANVASRGELDEAIRRMMDHDGPYLLNVAIREEDMVFPMTPAGSPVDCIMLNANEMYHPKKMKP